MEFYNSYSEMIFFTFIFFYQLLITIFIMRNNLINVLLQRNNNYVTLKVYLLKIFEEHLYLSQDYHTSIKISKYWNI